MSRATVPTLLSIDRYAALIGLNPVHFSGASGTTFWPEWGSCDDVWYQFPWQHRLDYASREDLALAIEDAEREIKDAIGVSAAPVWEEQEVHAWDGVYGVRVGIPTTWGNVISAGQRALTLIEATSAVVYSDPDADTWDELATITVTTSVTNKQQIKVYFSGHSGEPEWEVRPLQDIVIAGGTATITLDSWLLLDPTEWRSVPTSAGASPIDIEDSASYVTTVDVYQEFTDTTGASAVFFWEPTKQSSQVFPVCPSCSGTGCVVCTLTSQDGCFSVRDAKSGIVTPFAAEYDSTNEVWNPVAYAVCRDPDQIKLYYQAGLIDQDYLRGDSLDPLSDYLAQAISWLATARIDRDMCACDSTKKHLRELQRDLTKSTREAFFIRYEAMDIFNNPFGTRVGEVRAWNRVANLLNERRFDGGGF